MIESIDGGRLDNLDHVNVYMNVFSPTEASTATTGMRIFGGTYGSLNFTGGTTTIREKHLDSDVSFVGRAVKLGTYTGSSATNVPATVTDYGVILDVSTTMIKIMVTNTHDLSITRGLLMTDTGAAQTATSSTNRVQARLDAAGSTVTVGGDIVVSSTNNRPDSAAATQGRLSRMMGITGDADTVINLGGSWIHQMRSRSSAGLSGSTLNLVGGAGVKTFEVGDAATLNTLSSNSFGIKNLNIGSGATAGSVQLVNAYLNDNPIDFGAVTGTEKNGEKLIVGKLAVAANSTLDVNGQSVLVTAYVDPLVPAFLTVDAAGTLDLNTGLSLELNSIVPTFIGLGDQTSAWNLSAARVIDSDNPWTEFGATLSGGNTVWQVVWVPEPGSVGLVSIAGFGLLRRRRRD